MSTLSSEKVSELSPSAKLVFIVLEKEGALTQKGIAEETMLPSRTVRYALDRLQEIEAIQEDIYFADARQSIYQVV